MKIKYNLIPFVIILFSVNAYSQETSIYKISVGGKIISIPAPIVDFVEVGELKRKLIEDQVPKINRLVAFYLPIETNEKYGLEPVVVMKRILIEVLKANEYTDFSEKDFIDLKNSMKTSLSSGLDDATKEANSHYAKLKDRYGNRSAGKPIVLNTILDLKDSYSFLALMNVNTEDGLKNVLTGTLFIRVKNRILYIYVSNILEDDESLDWVSNTIKIWNKSIIDLNN